MFPAKLYCCCLKTGFSLYSKYHSVWYEFLERDIMIGLGDNGLIVIVFGGFGVDIGTYKMATALE